MQLRVNCLAFTFVYCPNIWHPKSHDIVLERWMSASHDVGNMADVVRPMSYTFCILNHQHILCLLIEEGWYRLYVILDAMRVPRLRPLLITCLGWNPKSNHVMH